MKPVTTLLVTLTASTLAATAFADGSAIFKAKCISCHPNGGNVINKEKTLHKKELAANKLRSVHDVVKYLRNPGPGMTKYDMKSLPDKDAKEVAEYIMKTFK